MWVLKLGIFTRIHSIYVFRSYHRRIQHTIMSICWLREYTTDGQTMEFIFLVQPYERVVRNNSGCTGREYVFFRIWTQIEDHLLRVSFEFTEYSPTHTRGVNDQTAFPRRLLVTFFSVVFGPCVYFYRRSNWFLLFGRALQPMNEMMNTQQQQRANHKHRV